MVKCLHCIAPEVTSIPHRGILVGMQCHPPGNSSLASFDNLLRQFKPLKLLSLAGIVIAIFEVGIWLFPGATQCMCV